MTCRYRPPPSTRRCRRTQTLLVVHPIVSRAETVGPATFLAIKHHHNILPYTLLLPWPSRVCAKCAFLTVNSDIKSSIQLKRNRRQTPLTKYSQPTMRNHEAHVCSAIFLRRTHRLPPYRVALVPVRSKSSAITLDFWCFLTLPTSPLPPCRLAPLSYCFRLPFPLSTGQRLLYR